MFVCVPAMIVCVQADPGGVRDLSPDVALGEVGGLEAGGDGQQPAGGEDDQHAELLVIVLCFRDRSCPS